MTLDAFRARLAAGHQHARAGEWALAASVYGDIAAREPGAAEAWYNLGVARHKLGDIDPALAALVRAWRADPTFAPAAQGAMALAAAAVRTGRRWPVPALIPLPAAPPHVSVVVCSIDDRKADATRAMYERLLAGVPHDVVLLRDARSLAEAYNRGIAATRGAVIVLSHDDIEIAAADFSARLVAHLAAHDAIGVVGASRFDGPVPVWAGHPHVRGWITHRHPGSARWDVNVVHPDGLAGGMRVLDGVFLAARREVFDAVPFDAGTFDGFHGYDVDWSARAAQAGWRLAAAGDLRVIHASGGSYDDVWRRYAERLCAKHAIGSSAPADSPYFRVTLGSTEAVNALFDALAAAAAPCDPDQA